MSKINLIAIGLLMVFLVGCGHSSDPSEPPGAESTKTSSPIQNGITGGWDVEKTIKVDKTDGAFRCLRFNAHVARIYSTRDAIRLEGTVLFTCIGPSLEYPVTWEPINLHQVFIKSPSGQTIRTKAAGGVFSEHIPRPVEGDSREGWIDFEPSISSYGPHALYLYPEAKPIPINIMLEVPVSRPGTHRIDRNLGTASECDPGKPCVNFKFSKDKTSVREPVTLNLSFSNAANAPDMSVVLLVNIPTGWSLSGVGSGDACEALCIREYKTSGVKEELIRLTVVPNQAGTVRFHGSVNWSFEGGDPECNSEDCGLKVQQTVMVTE